MQVLRKRTLHGDRQVNPSKRKPRRNLSRAQKLAGFGGKRAKAAARSSKPKSKAKGRASAAKRKTKSSQPRKPNPVLSSVGLAAAANPSKGKRSMAKSRKKASTRKKGSSKRKANGRKRTATARNPVRVTVVAPRPKRKRNGPRRSRSGATGGKLVRTLTMATAGAGGGIGTRALTQAVLGQRNSGMEGYAANAVTAFGLGWGAGKVFGKDVGTWVTVGGFIGIVLRAVGEYTEIGKRVNLQLGGMGDYAFAGVSKSLGHFEPMDFFVPLASGSTRGRVDASSRTPAAVARMRQLAAPPSTSGGGGDAMAGLAAGRSRYSGSRYWGAN